MATKTKSIVASAKAEQQEPRITATLVSVSDELKFNTLEDGSKGQGYYACSLKLANGKTVSGVVYATVVDKGIDIDDTVSCKVGTVKEPDGTTSPILRVLGVGSARATWADLVSYGIDAPSLEDSVF